MAERILELVADYFRGHEGSSNPIGEMSKYLDGQWMSDCVFCHFSSFIGNTQVLTLTKGPVSGVPFFGMPCKATQVNRNCSAVFHSPI